MIFLEYIIALQQTITAAVETIDGRARFLEDRWDRPEGGGGITKVMYRRESF